MKWQQQINLCQFSNSKSDSEEHTYLGGTHANNQGSWSRLRQLQKS